MSRKARMSLIPKRIDMISKHVLIALLLSSYAIQWYPEMNNPACSVFSLPLISKQLSFLSTHEENPSKKKRKKGKKGRKNRRRSNAPIARVSPVLRQKRHVQCECKTKGKGICTSEQDIDNKQGHLCRSPSKGRDTVERGASAAGRVSHYHVSAMY
jgi:hypothetical protein